MGRIRARLVAVIVVLAATVVAAYASLTATPQLADSNASVPTQSAARIVFSIRNNNASPIILDSFSPGSPAATNGCTMMTIGRLDQGALPATLDPGKQMQFVVDASNGFMNPGMYGCAWTANTTPPDPVTVTTTFIVTPPPGALDAQPKAMDFGSQSTGDFETQKVVLSNYLGARNVNLMIVGDLNQHDITFTDTGCQPTSCAVNLPAASFTTVNVACAPLDSENVQAMLMVGSGASLAMIPLHCNANSGGNIRIADHPIQITAPLNSVGMTTTQITGSGTTLGSATITTNPLDASFKITNCGAPSCTFGAQALPYNLTVECQTGTKQTMGTLTVYATVGGGSDSSTILCTSSGSPPVLDVGPISPFGGVAVGGYYDQPIDLTNTGGAQLDGLAITFPGINGAHWSALQCSPQSPCSIPASQTIQATIRFQPQGIGDKSTMMVLTSNASNSPSSVQLLGTGLGGIMSVIDPSGPPYILDIGSIPRGAPYSRTITLANTGNAPYTVMQSGAAAPYMVAPTTQTVGASSGEDFTVTCESATATPTNNEQTLHFDSADAYQGGSQDVTLRCKVEDTLVQVMPNQFDFGEVRVGTTPNPRTITVTVTNPANAVANAHISSMQLRTATPGLVLEPAMTDTTLTPGGSASATLKLSTDADTTLVDQHLDIHVDNAMLSFPVTGKVVTPHSRVAPMRLDLGTACVSSQVSGNVMLINDGTATLAVDPPQMDGSFVASSPGTPAMLAPSMSLSASVSPAMSAMGLVEGELRWHEDSEFTHRVPVSLEYVTTGTALSPKGLDFGILDAGQTSAPQHITLQNCDQLTATIKIEALRTTQGALAAWVVEPRIGYSKELRGKEVQAIDVTFRPLGRGMYEAELEVSTPAGPQKIHLVGEATGRDYDNTSFYACTCNGPGAPAHGWPVLAALVFIVRRRRGSSSPR